MLEEMFDWWQYNFWLGSAGVLVGIAIVSPFLLSKRFRKWFSRSSFDLEGLGIIFIVLAIIAIGIYNRFLAGGA